MENVIKVLEVPITVKVVYLEKKMLSMAFFRQIPYRDFFNFQAKKPNGTAIGYVKYYWKDNESYKPFTYHVLWSDGKTLFRSFLPNGFNNHSLHSHYLEDRINKIENEEEKEDYKRIIREIIKGLEHLYIGS